MMATLAAEKKAWGQREEQKNIFDVQWLNVKIIFLSVILIMLVSLFCKGVLMMIDTWKKI